MVVDPRDVKIAALEEEVAHLKKSKSAIEDEFIKLENQVNSLESWAYRPMYSDNPINRRGRY